MTEVAAEWIETGKLKPWDKNPRKNDDAARKVADSIRRFGFGAPIVARKEDSRIIAGHTRWKAAKMLGLKRVPVRLLDISERDADLLTLADNKLGELAEWDDEALAGMLSKFSLEEADDAGWGLKELGKLADEMFGPDGKDGGGSKLGDGLTYSVVVECDNEDHQTEILERLESEGLTCKPLVT